MSGKRRRIHDHMEIAIVTESWRKTVLASILVLISGSVFAAQTYKLRVDGLACPFCAYGVEKQLKAVKGIEKVDVDIKTGVVIVTAADGAAFDETMAKRAVTDAGFTLRGFERISSQGTDK